MGGLNVATLVIWKTSLVVCCLYPFLNGISSFAIRTLSPGFRFGFLTSLLDCCAICDTGFVTCFAETLFGANPVMRLFRESTVLTEDYNSFF